MRPRRWPWYAAGAALVLLAGWVLMVKNMHDSQMAMDKVRHQQEIERRISGDQ